MYRAKQRGRNRVEVFDDALQAHADERRHISESLTEALDSHRLTPARLTVAYQPVFELVGPRLVGFEALARLTGRDGSTIPPDLFIPVAEETGMINALGGFVLEEALSALARWRTSGVDRDHVTMAVNFSARQAQHSYLPHLISAALTRHGLAPADLTIEVTESVLMESGSSTLRQLTELHDSGVKIALDDFGTGYASLKYLVTLPVDTVKVDKSFTAGILVDATSETIVRAVASLAAQLHVQCIVEGIETPDQLAALPAGVLGQGYLLGKPAACLPETSELLELAPSHAG